MRVEAKGRGGEGESIVWKDESGLGVEEERYGRRRKRRQVSTMRRPAQRAIQCMTGDGVE
jgi:hypothetical protein